MKIESLLIGMLACTALVGCTSEEPLSLTEEGTAVQFTVNMEGALESRTISDGTGANTLMYGVFEKVSDTEMKQVIDKTVISNVEGLIGDGYRMSISLLRGKTYQVVFWAQNSNCEAYTVGDDMKVGVKYTGINNDELRDAFFATQQVTVASNSTVNVTLKRPFAQINVGAFKTDYEYAQSLGVTVNQSKATIKNVPNQIDLLTGIASGSVDVNYTFGNTPYESGESLARVDVDGDKNLETYTWVSMSYILASPERTTHEMNFAFINSADENNQILFEAGKEVPAQRNYRTNIVGQVLSSSYNFNINIDPVYDGDIINAGYVYYIFNEPTTIENTEFALNNAAYGHWCVFTCPKNVNHLITFNNVRFSGELYAVAFGEYYGNTYNNYSFNINEVVAENVKVANCVSNATDVFSLLFYLRGTTNVTNCTWTGTTTVENTSITDGQVNLDPDHAYDCGVPNYCNATISGSTIDKVYIWSFAQATITDSKIGYIRTAAINYKGLNPYLTIGSGAVVDKIEITRTGSYSTPLNILAGAEVKELVLNGVPVTKITIEPGAKVNGKTFEEGMSVAEFLGVE